MEAICRRTGVDRPSAAALPVEAEMELVPGGGDDGVREVADTDGATAAPL